MILSAVGIAGPVLELATLLLLVRRRLWRAYTPFFVYAVWLFVANSALLLTDLYFRLPIDRPIYAAVYWHIDSVDIVLRLLVVWEVFRQTFPKNSGLHRSLSKGLGMIAVVLLVLAGGTLWGYQNYSGLKSLHLALDRSFGFVQAVMILGTLVVARYYGVRFGRNVRGIALGFGTWASISTANSAIVDLAHSFLPYGDYLRPVSFVFMLVVWVWALWVYEPNPPIIESSRVELGQWAEEWNRTISTARTILRP
jgi:hypothetical protein